MKKVLVVGNGGREHALAWKLAHSEQVGRVYVAPGNAGTQCEAKVENVDIAVDDIDSLIAFVQQNSVDLTVVGPEVPLVMGIVDRFQAEGLRCLGPTAKAAQLEGSKAFCKDFLKQNKIPTADYEVFTQADKARAYLEQCELPIVLKADGLAAGKGVIIAYTKTEALAAVASILEDQAFGETAGARVVIESFLTGEEASFIVMVDGQSAIPLASSQDHKARDEGDQGPNTGGMGAYSPAPIVDESRTQKIMERIIQPTLDGLKAQGVHYVGFLYAGLMIDGDDIRVLEYNCRLGDPETQPIMMRLESDLFALCEAALDQRLSEQTLKWTQDSALGVVMAMNNYPYDYPKGAEIQGLDAVSHAKVFHAGSQMKADQVVTSGGRVLCVTALGRNLQLAHDQAYADVKRIKWDGAFYRRDIAHKAL